MSTDPLFVAAFPYADDVLALPVADVDAAVAWYGRFGLVEVERQAEPARVVMERDGVRIGFAVNGGDPSNEGAAIRVTDLDRARSELVSNGVEPGPERIDDRDGQRLRVFFVIAPDGLCFYFHQPMEESEEG